MLYEEGLMKREIPLHHGSIYQASSESGRGLPPEGMVYICNIQILIQWVKMGLITLKLYHFDILVMIKSISNLKKN